MDKSKTYVSWLLLLFLITAKSDLKAGDPVFSQFFAAPMYLNPSYAGSTACSRLGLNYRQWNSIDNFHAINFSYDTYSDRFRGGLGVIVTSDLSNAEVMQTNMGLIYSYHARISDNSFLNLAVQAGYIRNDSRLRESDFYAPGEDIGNFRGHDLDFSAGAMYFSDRIYGGVAVHHLNDPNMSLVEDGEDRRGRKYTAHVGMYFEPQSRSFRPGRGRNYFFSPNLIIQHHAYHEHFSGGLYFGREPVMIGGWLRHHRFQSRNDDANNPSTANNGPSSSINTLVFLAGLNMDDYRIGISYDYPVGSSEFSGLMTVFEVSLAFRFNCGQRNIGRGILNNPNF